MNIDKLFSELAQYKILLNDTQSIIDSLQDEIKRYMINHNLEVLNGSEHKVSYKAVTTPKIDGKRLKVDYPELAEKYTNFITSKRFTFN